MKFLKRTYSILSQALAHEGSTLRLLLKFLKVIFTEGISGLSFRLQHLKIRSSQVRTESEFESEPKKFNYSEWVSLHEDDSVKVSEAIKLLGYQPLISIICPVYNPDEHTFTQAIESVLDQQYQNWELCLADDFSDKFDTETFLAKFSDSRIKFNQREMNGNISLATNTALSLASGEYIALLDQDDILVTTALFWMVVELNKNPNLKFIYSDEDKLDEFGTRCDPHFKPDWNYEYFLTCNYICHLALYNRELIESLNGCREGFEGAQDYDLGLRVIEKILPTEISHIPRILYHWRKHPDSTSQNALAKPYAIIAGEKAIEEHLKRSGVAARVRTKFIRYEVKYELPSYLPKVTIIIPTKNGYQLLKSCIDSIEKKTSYSNYEILIVDNGSYENQTLSYLEQLSKLDHVRVLEDSAPFNFAGLMNRAIKACDTELICFLNNDIEVISKNWLSEMVSVINQQDIGAVGAKLLYPDDTIQHGGVILGVGGIAGHSHKNFLNDNPGYAGRLQARQELSAVTAACMLTKSSIFSKVQGMDEKNLSIAFNDIDYCLKLGALGLKIVWSPHSVLYHHESKTRGEEDTFEKVERFNQEVNTMKMRWRDQLVSDPAYNTNLTLVYEDFSIAEKSRNESLSQLISTLKQHNHVESDT